MASTARFTEKAQEAIVNAQRLTEEHNISQFEPIALLLALVDQSDGLVPQILGKLNVDAAAVRSANSMSTRRRCARPWRQSSTGCRSSPTLHSRW